MTISKVFVTQRPVPNHRDWVPNLAPATVFGEIKYVFEPEDFICTNPKDAMEKAKTRLADFNPETDYILYPSTGDPAAVYVICLCIGHWFTDHEIQFLYWDREKTEGGERSHTKGNYRVTKIPLYES